MNYVAFPLISVAAGSNNKEMHLVSSFMLQCLTAIFLDGAQIHGLVILLSKTTFSA